MRLAMRLLSASYLKTFLVPKSKQWEYVRRAEMILLHKLGDKITLSSPSATWMLITHHAIVFPELYRKPWTKLLVPRPQQFYLSSQSDVIIASHSIFLGMFLPLRNYEFLSNDYDWLVAGETEAITKINGVVGTSPQVLHFFCRIRKGAAVGGDLQVLFNDIKACNQWFDHSGSEESQVTRKTGTLYQLVARLYACIRLQG